MVAVGASLSEVMALMCSQEGKYIRIAYPSVSHPREGDGALRRACRPTESVAILGRRRWFVSASNGYVGFYGGRHCQA